MGATAEATAGEIPVGEIPAGETPVGAKPVGAIPVGGILVGATPAGTPVAGVISAAAMAVGGAHIPVGGNALPAGGAPVGTVELRGPRGCSIYGSFGASKLRLPSRAHLRGGSGVFAVSSIFFITAGSVSVCIYTYIAPYIDKDVYLVDYCRTQACLQFRRFSCSVDFLCHGGLGECIYLYIDISLT